jgi:hypothetical protein
VFAGCCAAVLVLGSTAAAQEQVVDSDFKATVGAPAYPQGGPTVAIDEAHSNFHTATGQYRPFADLLRSDGYTVRAFVDRFSPETLARIDVLVVANALPPDESDPPQPAFTVEECEAVREWVRGGGALLLISDHEPFGSAAAPLASRFGVAMGRGFAFDRADTSGITTQLIFSRAGGRLGEHPITRGRSAAEEIRLVRTFTGQSLGVPTGAAVLLPLSASAREAPTRDDLKAEDVAAKEAPGSSVSFGSRSTSVSSRAQGIAMLFGDGRVVVLGEAGFLTAQLIRWTDGTETRFGMNVPGNDDQQFALNVVHWLSRLLK